jgi:hypothetical protein
MSLQYDNEEEAIIEAYNRGEMTNAEMTNAEMMKELNELRRDYQAAAEDSAREAYDRELSRW